MNRRTFPILLLLIWAAEIAALLLFASQDGGYGQDAVWVNEIVQSVQADWNAMENHQNHTGLDYVVLDAKGNLLYKTGPGLSETINQAVIHRDTILDIRLGNSVVGKVMIDNGSAQIFQSKRRATVLVLSAAIAVQCALCTAYMFYLNRTIVQPFSKLKGFAQRIAGGNLDVPLEMDRQNIFGAFTESFDIMRAELKKARRAEALANKSKKELVAKLSHDIKTPVASIKAAAEVGAALSGSGRIRDNYTQIIQKADQINTLITNLFTATLEELEQLPVTPKDMESRELKSLLENADYLHRAAVSAIPGCVLYADKLRLQQVFDNIFANSYKYAGTDIEVAVCREGNRLAVSVEDYGGGVSKEELPFLKEKFKRGSNIKDMEGAGLGLYISDCFMKEMHGELTAENGENGLKVTVRIPLSGMV